MAAILGARSHAVEEAWARSEQEVVAEEHRRRLISTPAGAARLERAAPATGFAEGLLPAIAAQHLRLGAPGAVRTPRALFTVGLPHAAPPAGAGVHAHAQRL